MSQFTNIKKFTTQALVTTLLVGGSATTFTTDQALASGSCNNGHGNNAPISYSWDGGVLTIDNYDPSNNGQAHDGTDLIARLEAGSTATVGNGANATTFRYEKDGVVQSSYTGMSSAVASAIINNYPDWELKNGNIYDCTDDSNPVVVSDATAEGLFTISFGFGLSAVSIVPPGSTAPTTPPTVSTSTTTTPPTTSTTTTISTGTTTSNASGTLTTTSDNYCDVSSNVTNNAGITVTIEDAGIQTPQITSSNYVFDFNNPSFTSGGMTRTNASTTYTYEGNYTLSNADRWGGADSSRYIHTTLDVADCFRVRLDQDQKYFGFWWSAGDAYNKLTFKNDGVEVAVFVTEDLKNFIDRNPNIGDSSLYYGNPNGGNNSASNNEPYSFVNIFFDDNVSYDEIIFETTTDNGAGFESDNHTFSTSSDPRANRVTNDAPVAGDDAGEVKVTESIAIDLLANDNDPDLDLNTDIWTTEQLSISEIEGIDVTGGATVYLYKNGSDVTALASLDASNNVNYIGEASINNNGELEFRAAYLPNMDPGYNIEYTVADVFGDSDPSNPGTDNGTVNIKVIPFID